MNKGSSRNQVAATPINASNGISYGAMLSSEVAQLAQLAIDKQVLQFGDFTLKSGAKSKYFYNSGRFSCGASIHKLARLFTLLLQELERDQRQRDPDWGWDILLGSAYKGIPIVAAIALHLSATAEEGGATRSYDFAYDRKEIKPHGEGGQLVGTDVSGGRRVVIIDDVLTAGTALRASTERIKRAGGNVVAALVSFDRSGEKRSELERDLGYPICSVLNVQGLRQWLRSSDSEFQELADEL